MTMKYIRTKDGRIIDVEKFIEEEKKNPYYTDYEFEEIKNEEDCCFIHWSSVGTEQNSIKDQIGRRCQFGVTINSPFIKQADTIEELCDEFYIDYGQERFPYSTYRQYERYAGWGDLIRYLREIHFSGYDGVYGYIWVILPNNAPILKPVAKMKGVLPDGKIDWEVL